MILNLVLYDREVSAVLDVCLADPLFFYETLYDAGFCSIGLGVVYQINQNLIDANKEVHELLGLEKIGEDLLKKLLSGKGQSFKIYLRIQGRLRVVKVWPHRVNIDEKCYQISFIKRLR